MQQDLKGKLEEIFRAVLSLSSDADVTVVSQSTEPAWDSLAHALLVAAIESEFGIGIDVADSLELTSFEAVSRYLEAQGV